MITFENETRLDPMNQRHSAFLENPKDASREEAMDLFCDLFGLGASVLPHGRREGPKCGGDVRAELLRLDQHGAERGDFLDARAVGEVLHRRGAGHAEVLFEIRKGHLVGEVLADVGHFVGHHVPGRRQAHPRRNTHVQ